MENFDNLKKTPLFEKHCALGGKIVDFGGWALPVQYTSILDECKAVRERAGLFDVSHMGEVDIIGNDAYAYMQKIGHQRRHFNDARQVPLCRYVL